MVSKSDPVVIDLTTYKDKVGARVDPGRYKVQVEDVESDTSAKGNPMIVVWLQIIGGPFAGQTILDRLTMSEKSMFRVVNFMRALGLPTPKKRLSVNIRSWVGRVLLVDVEDGDPYMNKIKSEVRGYEQAQSRTAAATVAPDGDELDGLGTPDPTDDDIDRLPAAVATAETARRNGALPDDQRADALDGLDEFKASAEQIGVAEATQDEVMGLDGSEEIDLDALDL